MSSRSKLLDLIAVLGCQLSAAGLVSAQTPPEATPPAGAAEPSATTAAAGWTRRTCSPPDSFRRGRSLRDRRREFLLRRLGPGHGEPGETSRIATGD